MTILNLASMLTVHTWVLFMWTPPCRQRRSVEVSETTARFAIRAAAAVFGIDILPATAITP